MPTSRPSSEVSSSRAGKAEVKRLCDQGRAGVVYSVGDEIVGRVSAAQVRAGLLRAARREADSDDPSPEAEAGAILEAETAVEIHEIRDMIRAYLDALARG